MYIHIVKHRPLFKLDRGIGRGGPTASTPRVETDQQSTPQQSAGSPDTRHQPAPMAQDTTAGGTAPVHTPSTPGDADRPPRTGQPAAEEKRAPAVNSRDGAAPVASRRHSANSSASHPSRSTPASSPTR